MEANKKDDIDKFPFPGYNIYILEKIRKVTSGLVLGVTNIITSIFETIKFMIR